MTFTQSHYFMIKLFNLLTDKLWGFFDDGTDPTAQYVYTVGGSVLATVRVTDNEANVSTASILITVDNSPPGVTILAPSKGFTWSVGEPIAFSGEAMDPDSGLSKLVVRLEGRGRREVSTMFRVTAPRGFEISEPRSSR